MYILLYIVKHAQNEESGDMFCDSCKENYITFNNNCYKEYDSKTKTFYLPESTEIGSCYELYWIYI